MKIFLLLLGLFIPIFSKAQTETESSQVMLSLEEIAEKTDAEPQNDSRNEFLLWLKKHPVNLNAASQEELGELGLTHIQLLSFFQHIKLYGSLISIYELQVIPHWDETTIRNIRPFVFVGEQHAFRERLKEAFKKREHLFLLRTSQIMEKSRGYSGDSNAYQGSRQKILLRYRYNASDRLQLGFTAKKDPGEPLFTKDRKKGFDFYSFHFFTRKNGMLHSLAIGDYSIQLGQGLIQWQATAFLNGSLSIKKQAAPIKPYVAAGEFHFHRGVAVTLQRRKWQLTGFFSSRKLNASLNENGEGYVISSIYSSGLNRTAAELARRKNLPYLSFGNSLRYTFVNGHVAFNVVHHKFAFPFEHKNEPYTFIANKSPEILNGSIDFSVTRRNLHYFGEWACDKWQHPAILNGILVALDEKADLVLLQRSFHKRYRSFFSDAFGMQSASSNETGLYTGFSLRPTRTWQVECLADLAIFPWLRYRTDAPSTAQTFKLSAKYLPTKHIEVFSQLNIGTRKINTDLDPYYHQLATVSRYTWRTQVNMNMSREFTLRQRMEFSWYKTSPSEKESGFLFYVEGFYKPYFKIASINFRCQFFEIPSYNARIYAYEQDVLYSSTVPAFDGKGFHYYFNFHLSSPEWIKKRIKAGSINAFLRWSQIFYINKAVIGSGMDELKGSKKSEIKLQLIFASE